MDLSYYVLHDDFENAIELEHSHQQLYHDLFRVYHKRL